MTQLLNPASPDPARGHLTTEIPQCLSRNSTVGRDDIFNIAIYTSTRVILNRRQDESFLPKIARRCQTSKSPKIGLMGRRSSVTDDRSIYENRHERHGVRAMSNVALVRVVEENNISLFQLPGWKVAREIFGKGGKRREVKRK